MRAQFKTGWEFPNLDFQNSFVSLASSHSVRNNNSVLVGDLEALTVSKRVQLNPIAKARIATYPIFKELFTILHRYIFQLQIEFYNNRKESTRLSTNAQNLVKAIFGWFKE